MSLENTEIYFLLVSKWFVLCLVNRYWVFSVLLILFKNWTNVQAFFVCFLWLVTYIDSFCITAALQLHCLLVGFQTCSELLWSKTFSLTPCLTNRNPVYQMCIFSLCTRPLEWFMTVLTVINCLVTFMSTWDLFICYWYTNTVHSCSKLPTCMTGHSKLLLFYCIAVIIVVESLRSDLICVCRVRNTQ